MTQYTQESLELLRQRVELVEVLTPHVNFKRSGATFKALCPFHEEKTPSFIINRGDTHYHCFGCGAHGDAIQFLINHQKMSFIDAVEYLAEKFHVTLEKVAGSQEEVGPSKSACKEVLEKACRFYHNLLLHTQEGHQALDYLYKRGIDLEFVKMFQIGFCSAHPYLLQKALYEEKITKDLLEQTGLIKIGSDGKARDFFTDRILFPIRDGMGSVIGFSGRKFKEETFGPKYVNTPETILFKKSKVLFGLNYSRKRIAKERKAIIVEGQIDALRLIYEGFTIVVAGQGTAFGVEHVKELIQLGVHEVYLALDGDLAGQEATLKIGDLFQKEAIEVFVVTLPQGYDPDLFLRNEGPEKWEQLLEKSKDYLTYLIESKGKKIDTQSPAGKNEWVQTVADQIRKWEHPLMVHESLRKLARITQTPESSIGIAEETSPNLLIKKSDHVAFLSIDPDRVMEMDLLRWLLLLKDQDPFYLEVAKANLLEEHFFVPVAKRVYQNILEKKAQEEIVSPDEQDMEKRAFLEEVFQKKVNLEKAKELFLQTVQRMLDRLWMHKREEIKLQIQSGLLSDEEVSELGKQFDLVRKNRPLVITLEQKATLADQKEDEELPQS